MNVCLLLPFAAAAAAGERSVLVGQYCTLLTTYNPPHASLCNDWRLLGPNQRSALLGDQPMEGNHKGRTRLELAPSPAPFLFPSPPLPSQHTSFPAPPCSSCVCGTVDVCVGYCITRQSGGRRRRRPLTFT